MPMPMDESDGMDDESTELTPDDENAEGIDEADSDFENQHEHALAMLLAELSDDEIDEIARLAEESNNEVGRSRFSRLSAALGAKGAANPDALSAWIGRRKYGRAGFAALAAKGRAKKSVKSAGRKAMRSRPFGHDEILRFERYWPAEVEIVRGGSGREVTAYAAVFDSPNEIQDQHGHYMEVIDRSAFNRTLSQRGPDRVALLLNHGYHPDGTPSALGGVPLGSFTDIRADGKGLLTRARYNNSDLADAVLEAVRHGDIKGYSFRGRVFRSDPMRVPRIQRGGALPRVTRQELGLSDAGPTQSPWYSDASIVAVRSKAISDAYVREARESLPLRERIVIARALLADDGDTTDLAESTVDTAETAPVTPDVSEVDTTDPADAEPTPSDEGPGAEDSPEGALLPAETARSLSAADIRRRARIALITRGHSLKEGN